MASGSREDFIGPSPFRDSAAPSHNASLLSTPLPEPMNLGAETPGTPATPYTDPFSTPAQNSYTGLPPGTPALPSRPVLSEHDRRQASDAPLNPGAAMSEKPVATPVRRRRLLWLGVAAAAIIVIFLAVFLPIFFTVIKKKSGSSSSAGPGSSSSSSPGSNPESPTGATTGGDGSVIQLADGTSFTYRNPFGGTCASTFVLPDVVTSSLTRAPLCAPSP